MNENRKRYPTVLSVYSIKTLKQGAIVFSKVTLLEVILKVIQHN